MEKEQLDNYFRNVWKPNTDQYRLSGWAIVDKIYPPETVLDVGCGYNQFKQYFGDRLTGIDPYNSNADSMVSIEQFDSTQKWDVALCLGSINFGDRTVIRDQTEKVVSLLKSGGRIYWRQNPGRKDHKNKECEVIDFFKWSFMENLTLAEELECDVIHLEMDNGNRMYSEWIKR